MFPWFFQSYFDCKTSFCDTSRKLFDSERIKDQSVSIGKKELDYIASKQVVVCLAYLEKGITKFRSTSGFFGLYKQLWTVRHICGGYGRYELVTPDKIQYFCAVIFKNEKRKPISRTDLYSMLELVFQKGKEDENFTNIYQKKIYPIETEDLQIIFIPKENLCIDKTKNIKDYNCLDAIFLDLKGLKFTEQFENKLKNNFFLPYSETIDINQKVISTGFPRIITEQECQYLISLLIGTNSKNELQALFDHFMKKSENDPILKEKLQTFSIRKKEFDMNANRKDLKLEEIKQLQNLKIELQRIISQMLSHDISKTMNIKELKCAITEGISKKINTRMYLDDTLVIRGMSGGMNSVILSDKNWFLFSCGLNTKGVIHQENLGNWKTYFVSKDFLLLIKKMSSYAIQETDSLFSNSENYKRIQYFSQKKTNWLKLKKRINDVKN